MTAKPDNAAVKNAADISGLEAVTKHMADTRQSKETLTKTLSTWGVIRGWDRATEKMNACFSNLLLDLQKEERRQKEEAERKVREVEKRKQDLLKGNPFKLSTMSRANRIRRSPQPMPNLAANQQNGEYIGKNALRSNWQMKPS